MELKWKIKVERLNKRWKFKRDEIKNKRRGPVSEQKMRYFKIPLSRNFARKAGDYSDRMTLVSGVLGQKLGYHRCPYLSFFVWRFEDEIFDLTGRRDVNTKYTIFDLRCLWMLVMQLWMQDGEVTLTGTRNHNGIPVFFEQGIRLR